LRKGFNYVGENEIANFVFQSLLEARILSSQPTTVYVVFIRMLSFSFDRIQTTSRSILPGCLPSHVRRSGPTRPYLHPPSSFDLWFARSSTPPARKHLSPQQGEVHGCRHSSRRRLAARGEGRRDAGCSLQAGSPVEQPAPVSSGAE
jgi:hypothetical protein